MFGDWGELPGRDPDGSVVYEDEVDDLDDEDRTDPVPLDERMHDVVDGGLT